jgi:hypothetical protein
MAKKDEGRVFTPEQMALVCDPVLNAENEAVNQARALEVAEGSLETVGRAFGEAMLVLRKATKNKDWMQRLKRLGINYHKAYYWINVVEGKSNNRHKRYEQDDVVLHKPRRSGGSSSSRAALSWEDAASRLNSLIDDIAELSAIEPAGKESLRETLERFAVLLGFTLVSQEGTSRVEDTLVAALVDAVHDEGTAIIN